mmetsp:Transcript_2489/g.4283  ORF Transcript_2489/g.4283 Transcript_2489/m.4283 type:complete len:366 (+) Transcript_2489:134-1231(+)
MGCGAVKQDPLEGYQIFKKYEFSMKIGVGATSQVHEASQKESGKPVAVKAVVKEESHLAGKSVLLLHKEVDIMRMLNHPNICKLLEMFEDHLIFYFVLEICEGGTLFERLETDIVLEETDGAVIARQMFSAVAHLHDKNILHRDLRPENWLFSTFSQESPVKLINFGLAEMCDNQTALSQPCGTLHYVAPEVLRGKYGRPSDAWTLGVLVFLMLYGSYPFDGDSVSLVLRAILSAEPDWSDSCYALSNDVKDLLKQMLVKDPDERINIVAAYNHGWIKKSAPRKSEIEKAQRPSQKERNSQRMSKSVSGVLPEIKGSPGKGRRTSALVTNDLLRQIAADAMNNMALPATVSEHEENSGLPCAVGS